MAITTANMGLIKWTEGTDPYDHAQLASNFQRIDEHDHTQGKGARLKSASLENEAIGTAQLANLSVTDAKLAGGITSDKLAAGVVGYLGELMWFWRPNSATPIPTGDFVIAAGQTLSASEHEFPGGGSIILPNMIDKMAFGVEVANIGSIGGTAAINLEHIHGVNPHFHSINEHNHFLNLETGYNANTNLKISQDLSGSSFVHADNENNVAHKHPINGSSDSVALNTNNDSGTTTAGSGQGTVSNIPPNVGWLPMIRVKF